MRPPRWPRFQTARASVLRPCSRSKPAGKEKTCCGPTSSQVAADQQAVEPDHHLVLGMRDIQAERGVDARRQVQVEGGAVPTHALEPQPA